MDINLENIARAAKTIDPVFRDTPQYVDEQLCAELARRVLVKVETANPLRSFKGRGADFLATSLPIGQTVVCASAGNFGQALAYAGRNHGFPVEVFVSDAAVPDKITRMRALGATVFEVAADFTGAKEAARQHAGRTDAVFIEDGREPAITEGAGSIAVELLRSGLEIDTAVIPVGDGALITGMARWLKEHSPGTRVVGVCASGAPAVARAWAGRTYTGPVHTIADGIAVRVPVPEAVPRLRELVDDIVLVDDDAIRNATAVALRTLGLVLEPAGATGLAAIAVHDIPGETIATVLTGSNV
ncbi:threonine dehydratase [Saccharothrix tamanrassetensis]|uniref:Threonine dehydratase n=1 Tax=Saccharothrix tamanrassetensis TaxID=1051531 RepID=A0A841CJJ7_9PSEU|nr:pyridoxal-phosphate dependent enzyme [Saccharothrix tamanrassetensis]MBB5956524.1 threonine dehydratase [Saccharothrix tamanrassetensis]